MLIDFEWVRPGNSLLNSMYFRMNFPTCWCAKALPEDVVEELESLYRKTIASIIKASLDDTKYNESYVAACGFWLLSSMPFALRVMDKDECWSSGPVPTDSLWKPEANLACCGLSQDCKHLFRYQKPIICFRIYVYAKKFIKLLFFLLQKICP
ncbi:hypothetical protein OTUT144_0530 [Orientia tsutsugamushi str. UT144]|uniref:Uncharacterized protein n=1 Tax=Orientia tsutsugamushi str. UT144 TaxID=1441384 RepID=A0A0F3RQK0_ORITS|nr:hypothetical protein OTUT144_0530 [Orientia tsutsugamushi str. UT144]